MLILSQYQGEEIFLGNWAVPIFAYEVLHHLLPEVVCQLKNTTNYWKAVTDKQKDKCYNKDDFIGSLSKEGGGFKKLFEGIEEFSIKTFQI